MSQNAYSHPLIGRFMVQANPITPGSDQMRFDLKLETPSGQRIETQHHMLYSTNDPAHGGHSSLSFGDIELPEEMQGKGLGTMYLAAAAEQAKKLGVELVAIDNVVSAAMRTLCNRVGMTQRFVPGFYELDPNTLLRNCESRAANKGWQTSRID
jgi:GNAT superfamily N-acetyltransferase